MDVGRTRASPPGATVKKLGEPYTLACSQLHHTMDAAGLLDNKFKDEVFDAIRSATRAEYDEQAEDENHFREYWKHRKPGLLPEDDDVSDEEPKRPASRGASCA